MFREPKVHSLWEEIADIIRANNAFTGLSGPWSSPVSRDDFPGCAIFLNPHLPMDADLVHPSLRIPRGYFGDFEGCAIQWFRLVAHVPDEAFALKLTEVSRALFEGRVLRFDGGLELLATDTSNGDTDPFKRPDHFVVGVTMELYRCDGGRPVPGDDPPCSCGSN
jgi:hypothetical protein